MKRTLIGLAVAGLLANAAFAEPTLTTDESWKNAPESVSYQDAPRAGVQTNNTYGQDGIYSFNP